MANDLVIEPNDADPSVAIESWVNTLGLQGQLQAIVQEICSELINWEVKIAVFVIENGPSTVVQTKRQGEEITLTSPLILPDEGHRIDNAELKLPWFSFKNALKEALKQTPFRDNEQKQHFETMQQKWLQISFQGRKRVTVSMNTEMPAIALSAGGKTVNVNLPEGIILKKMEEDAEEDAEVEAK